MVQYVDGLVTACRVAMSRDTSKNAQPTIKQLLLSRLNISTLEPASCLSQSLAKYGWNRQCISAVRVNMSGRTVIVGNPSLSCDEVVIPG